MAYGFLSRKNAANSCRIRINDKRIRLTWKIQPFTLVRPFLGGEGQSNPLVPWKQCSDMLLKYLTRFRTSIQEDCRILCKEQELPDRMKLAVRYRLEKKQLVRRSIRFCDNAVVAFTKHCPSSRYNASPKYYSKLYSLAQYMNQLQEQDSDWMCEGCP